MAKKGFTIHHNGPPAKCVGQPHARCVSFWNGVRSYHGTKFGSKWAATSLYSFGVCPHGIRFVGCGWDMNQAANGRDVVGPYDGKDSEWYTVIVFLGTDEKPTTDMVREVRALIHEGRSSNRCGLAVLPHNAFKQKACPGPEFTALAKAWNGLNFPLNASPSQEIIPVQFATHEKAVQYVTGAYRALAGREPDKGGLDHWVWRVRSDDTAYRAMETELLAERGR